MSRASLVRIGALPTCHLRTWMLLAQPSPVLVVKDAHQRGCRRIGPIAKYPRAHPSLHLCQAPGPTLFRPLQLGGGSPHFGIIHTGSRELRTHPAPYKHRHQSGWLTTVFQMHKPLNEPLRPTPLKKSPTLDNPLSTTRQDSALPRLLLPASEIPRNRLDPLISSHPSIWMTFPPALPLMSPILLLFQRLVGL